MRLFLFVCWFFPCFIAAQDVTSNTIVNDGIDRDFFLSIPSSYDGNTSMPVIFNFHGFGSNATQQMFYGSFAQIAESEGIILVHPEGTLIQDQAHWNVGFSPDDSEADDIGFTEAMIEYLIENYNIDETRIYATGMSNGGFMSHLLACQLGDRFAAIASVTGSMTPETFNDCWPTPTSTSHPTPIMQIHGTNDETVPYDGALFALSIDQLMEEWVSWNNCNTTPLVEELEDTNVDDGSTVTYFRYSDCDNNITNELFRINNGGHTWPGAFFVLPGTNLDINASEEIWKFFSQYDINGRLASSIDDEQLITSVNVFPNPTTGLVNIDSDNVDEFEVFNIIGRKLSTSTNRIVDKAIDLSSLPKGLYFLKIENQVFKIKLVE